MIGRILTATVVVAVAVYASKKRKQFYQNIAETAFKSIPEEQRKSMMEKYLKDRTEEKQAA